MKTDTKTLSVVVCLAALCGLPLAANDPEPGALVDAGRFRKAQGLLEAAVKANPNDGEAAYQLSRVKLARSDAERALSLAERAAALQPKNAAYRLQVANVVGRQAQKASIFSQVGLARRVKREAEAALALDPNYLDALDTLRQYYLQAPAIAGGNQTQAGVLAARIRALSAVDGIFLDVQQAIDDNNRIGWGRCTGPRCPPDRPTRGRAGR